MSLTSLPASPETPSRTVTDVYTERGAEYPKRQNKIHGISNKKDRADYLIVAYSLMTMKRSDALSIILGKTGTDRATVLMAFKPVGTQLGLWGIIKKILSYDNGVEITTPSVKQVETLLLEMQDLFAPVKKVIYVPPVVIASPTLPSSGPVKEPEIGPRTFMGLPVIDPYVLAILDGLQVEEPKVVEQTPTSTLPQSKTQPTVGVSVVSNMVQSKVAPLLPTKSKPPGFQRPILPAAPRRGFIRQHWGRTAPFIPHHLRTAPVLPGKSIEQNPTPMSAEPLQPTYDIPHFDDLRNALVWLHERTHWHDLYRHIEQQLRDDLAVMSYLAQQNGELRAVLLNIKAKFRTSMKQIISYLFRPETIPNTPLSDQAVSSTPEVEIEPETSEQSEDLLEAYIRLFDRFKLNERYMSVVRTICDLHMRGDYEQFLRERDAFFQTGKKRKAAHAELFDINAALDEIVLRAQSVSEDQGNIDKTKVMFDLCEYRPGKGELFVYDATQESLYAKHTWTTRIAELLAESSQKEAFQKLLTETSESRLVEGLKAITIKIPRHNKHNWAGYEEKEALETRLYFILEDMVVHQHNGDHNWNKHVTIIELQKLMGKINFSGIE